jgi:hypothetical protein
VSVAEYAYRVRFAMCEWCVTIKDPKGVPYGRYTGFDNQTEAEEWAGKFVALLNEHRATGGRARQ